MAVISGRGTSEQRWMPWLNRGVWPSLNLDDHRGRRVVVLAAHPDDEVLGAAGLMVDLARRSHEIVVLWATDGEASHPDSTTLSPTDLGALRREESWRALARLGLEPTSRHHLALPDGQLSTSKRALQAAVCDVVRPDDVVLCPWVDDGHPDHEAVGEIASYLRVAAVWQNPIWMWHWAVPADVRVPWMRLSSVDVPDPEAKRSAIAEFASQTQPLSDRPEDAAILPPHVVDRFVRDREWIFV